MYFGARLAFPVHSKTCSFSKVYSLQKVGINCSNQNRMPLMMNETHSNEMRIQKKARGLPAEGIRERFMAKVMHLIDYEECVHLQCEVHLQCGSEGSLGKEEYESDVFMKAGSPRHMPHTERLRMFAH